MCNHVFCAIIILSSQCRRGLRVYDDPGFLRQMTRLSKDLKVACNRPYRHKSFLFSDEFFIENGLTVYETVQEKNEIMFTDCLGFHWGLNLGFNLNCAKNLAPAYWLDYGLATDSCSCQ